MDDMPYEMKETAKKNPITLYTFDKCGEPCKLAQELLDKRGVPYMIKNGVEHKAELQKLGSADKMPVMLVGSKIIRQGFLESSWNRTLDEAGYPKSNPLAKFHKKPSPAPKAEPIPESTPPALSPTHPSEP
jgi:glutaredoxin